METVTLNNIADMPININNPLIRILLLVLAWGSVAAVAYTQSYNQDLKYAPVQRGAFPGPQNLISGPNQGLVLYNKKNCAACHSLMGLGGHLGPDLTNVYQRRGSAYIHYILKNGQGKMPAQFKSEVEILQVEGYLKQYSNLVQYPLKSWWSDSFGRSQPL